MGNTEGMASPAKRAESWAARVGRRLPGPLRRLAKQAEGEDITLIAASLGFYAIVSIVPLLIMVLWVVSLLLGDQRVEEVARHVGRIAPKSIGADTMLQRVAELGTGLGVTAILAGLWPATSYGSGLVRAFDRLSGRRERMKGLRGRGLVLVVLLPLFVIGGLVASFAGSQAAGHGVLGRTLGLVVALATGFVGSSIAIGLIYRIFPPRPLPWRSIALATGVTAAGVSLLSLVFVLYLSLGANFEDHYATSGITGIVLLAIWLFLSNALLLIGYKIALDMRNA